MTSVLFLRSPSDSPDRYESAFSSAGYASSSVPVLETVFVNTEVLVETLCRASHHEAVIITSGRACEAWSNAVDALEGKQTSSQDTDWRSVPFYVVGEKTASLLRAMRPKHPNSLFTPADIRGETSGTSEQLANFILADLDSLPPSKRRPLLYLTGDKNRDTLPEIMHRGNFELAQVQVYQTQGSSAFPRALQLALDSPHHRNSNAWWIVFFAPSAAEFVMPFLRDHFDLLSTESTSVAARGRSARIASIGPTTSTFLHDRLHLFVHAVARKPTPEDLLEAIIATEKAAGD